MTTLHGRASGADEPGCSSRARVTLASFFAPARPLIHASRSHQAFARIEPHILFGKYTGQDIKLDGEEYFIMKEDDVLAIIEGRTKKTLAPTRGTAKITQKRKK